MDARACPHCKQPVESEYQYRCNACIQINKQAQQDARAQAQKLLAETEAKFGAKFTPSQKRSLDMTMDRIVDSHCRCGFMVIKDLEITPLSEEREAAGFRTLRVLCRVDFPNKSTLAEYTFHGFIGRHGGLQMIVHTFGAQGRTYKGRSAFCF